MPSRTLHADINLVSTDYSTQHYHSARIFSEHAAELETKYATGERPPEIYTHHQAYSSGAILSSCAFLEAYINETFDHAASKHGRRIEGLEPSDQELLARLWRRGIPRTARYSILEKYEIALDLLGRASFDRGAEPYQGTQALVRLRNALIHFEPEFYPIVGPGRKRVPKKDVPDLEKQLRKKFPMNPFAREDFPFFPDKCLGAGCAMWGVDLTVRFAKDFVEKMGIVERWKAPFGESAE